MAEERVILLHQDLVDQMVFLLSKIVEIPVILREWVAMVVEVATTIVEVVAIVAEVITVEVEVLELLWVVEVVEDLQEVVNQTKELFILFQGISKKWINIFIYFVFYSLL